MLLDLIVSDNQTCFNIKLANVIGLHSAIYINEVLNINQKAIKKNKVDNGFIYLDRNYIQQRTTLTVPEQLEIDNKLTKINLVMVQENVPDKIKLNVDILTAIIMEEDESTLENLSKKTTLKGTSSGTKLSARQRIIQNLKNSIQCTNEELREAYVAWVDGVYANPKGFLSNKSIKLFQEGVDAFSQGDLDLALKIVDIATINGWRCVDWAIEYFQKNYANIFYSQRRASMPSVSVSRAQLSDEVF